MMTIDEATQLSDFERLDNIEFSLDKFSLELFYTLDMLGLMSTRWNDKPHAYEKWARELIAPLKRKKANFDEVLSNWESRVIRASSNSRKNSLDKLYKFLIWCKPHGETIRENAQHLLSSLLARAFIYVYSVRAFSDLYTELHKGEIEAFAPEIIKDRFSEDVKALYLDMEKEGRINRRQMVMARDHLIKNAGLYKNKTKKETNGGNEE